MSGQEVEVYEAHPVAAPPTLFGTDDPAAVVTAATAAAKPLAEVVERQQLYKNISGKKHVLVEGWTLLGSMLGVFPVTVWTKALEDGSGWEARVEARTRSGEVVGAAEAMCTRGESLWRNGDEYAIRSMAQTRATSKALRQPLGFVMQLAGFQASPFEEMPRDPEPADDGPRIGDADYVPFEPGVHRSTFEPPAGATNPRGDVTEAQIKMIRRLIIKLGEQGTPEESLRDQLELSYGTRHTSELTKAQASQVITDLKKQAGE